MKSPPLKSPQDLAKTRSSLTPISKLDGVLSSPVVAKRRVSSFGAPEVWCRQMDFESWRSQGADELVLQQAIESMNEEMRTLAQELADEREAVKRLDSPRLVPSVKKVASPTAPAVEWVPVAGSSLREQQLLLQVEEQTGQLRTQEKQIRELERKVKALTSELANCNLNLYAC
mmetsp:Transcript_69334/g.163057  ORF Transcript_69334/g.163057 Transcript_69334/m.163057 type:complete len:173 (-) Transcript_69334:27-545(-)